MAKVLLKDINKLYSNGFHAVHDVNIDISDQEFVVLVGPSGCGKSTTLRMIAGLEEISSGDLMIGDERVNDMHPKDRNIAMVFQNYALYPHMSVFENMAFSLRMNKTSKDDINRRVNSAAEILHIENLLDRKPKQLSGGQRQRVALGRAIVRDPQVFLFDEPLSNLDAKLRVTMRAEISRLHNQLRSTMVYVTHDQIEAMTMGDRIVVMKDGYIHQIDTPMNLYNNPINHFVAGFIGSPPMNFHNVTFTDGMIKNTGISIKPGEQQLKALAPFNGKKVIMGIRAEDLLPGVNTEGAIKGIIDVVEPLGSEIMLYIRAESGESFVVKSDPSKIYKVNEPVVLGVRTEKCYYFNPEETTGSNGKKECAVIK